jgi:rSAM/selenodomain-associated transferase 1
MQPASPENKMPIQGRLTAIMSKQPVAGRVKTRLCPPLQPQEAAELAAAMLRDAIERCSLADRNGCFQTALWYAPDSARAWFEQAAVGWNLHSQVGAGLAERMARAFNEGLGQPGIESMVMIGSDQPMVGQARLVEAHGALEAGADVVFGPDAGGGYYLVGLRRPAPKLFTEITMSTTHMLRDSVALAEGLGLSVTLLEAGYDVDLESDLIRLASDLAAWNDPSDPDFPRHSQAFIDLLPEHLARILSHG